MKTRIATSLIVISLFAAGPASAGPGSTAPWKLESSALELRRPAQPNAYFDKCGRKFAILGTESGTFEAWAYPLKLVRNFEFSFLLGSSTQPIAGRDIVRSVSATPAATTLTYAFQSFTVKAVFIAAAEDPGAVIVLAVETVEPLTVVCSFLPVLQPMWPAGLGGQYASWDGKLKAYLIGEPTRKNHGYVGSPGAQGVSYTPAHMLSDAPTQFKIPVEPAAGETFIPVVLAGGKGRREDVRAVYEKLASNPEAVYKAAAEHYRELSRDTLRIKTPNPALDLAFEWAKVAYDNLLVDNPDLGRGLVAGLGLSGTSGRPGFGWFFGGDAFMNSLSLSGYGAFGTVKDALLFTQKWQRADGKMAHELSQAAGYLDWFKDYPYGYIHGDTTPFYIVAVDEYARASGDADFVRKSWDSLRKAFDWCLTTDEDGDGLMDNRKAGLGALEFGALTGIRTDIYLAAAWARAALAMERLARISGDPAEETRARGVSAKALAAIEAKFWDEEKGQYTYAFNSDGKQVKELTPWSSVPLVWGQGQTTRSLLTLEKINGADMTTDWGVRMLSSRSAYFEPLNYNYGAVWPFLGGWTAAALFKHGFVLQGFGLLTAAVRHTFDNGLGFVTELFSGRQNIWPQEAVAHQGFSSSGVVFPLIRGLLGLESDAVRNEIDFEPRFPADWTEVTVENIKVGGESWTLAYRRLEGRIKLRVQSTGRRPHKFLFAPSFGPGTRFFRASIDGRAVRVKLEQDATAQAVRPVVEAVLAGEGLFEIEFEPTAELLPPANDSPTGDPNRGLRIIRTRLLDRRLTAVVEGLSGETYRLKVTHPELIRSVRGASLNGAALEIHIPPAAAGDYVRTEFGLNLR